LDKQKEKKEKANTNTTQITPLPWLCKSDY